MATIEDHGPHLPVDTDIAIVSAIRERAAQGAVDHRRAAPPADGFVELVCAVAAGAGAAQQA